MMQQLVLLAVLAVTAVTSQQPTTTKVTIRRHIDNLSHGFHRYLITKITLDNLPPSSACTNSIRYLLLDKFDTRVYVDNYELRQAKYKRQYAFFMSNKVNVENSSYTAQPFQLYLYFNHSNFDCTNNNNSCSVSLLVPVHARYHAPSVDSEGYLNYTLDQEPRLFVLSNCSAESYAIVAQESMPCHRPFNFTDDHIVPAKFKSRYEKQIRESLENLTYCNWNELSFVKDYTVEDLKLAVPIGQSDRNLIILVVTLIVVTFLSLSLAKAVHKKVRSVNCYFINDSTTREELENEISLNKKLMKSY